MEQTLVRAKRSDKSRIIRKFKVEPIVLAGIIVNPNRSIDRTDPKTTLKESKPTQPHKYIPPESPSEFVEPARDPVIDASRALEMHRNGVADTVPQIMSEATARCILNINEKLPRDKHDTHGGFFL